jgi:cytochrome c oxidase subunit II
VVVFGSALDPVGPAARDIEHLWWLMFWLGLAVFVLFGVLLAGAVRRSHRAAGEGDAVLGEDDVHGRSARPWLLGLGVVLPAVVVTGVLVATIFAMRATADEADGALEVQVVGNQFWWQYAYPPEGGDGGLTTANELHIPAGEPVRLVLTSTDVIHSFWVPALAGKMDALPDGDNVLTVQADAPGTYLGHCAEFCGLQHANMEITVIAHDAEGFRRWRQANAEPAAPPDGELAEQGLQVMLDEGCGSCHTVRGTALDGEGGPDLTHLASRRAIAGGMLTTTAEDLRRWLQDPHAVKEGTTMPRTALSAEQLDAVVAYLEGLR